MEQLHSGDLGTVDTVPKRHLGLTSTDKVQFQISHINRNLLIIPIGIDFQILDVAAKGVKGGGGGMGIQNWLHCFQQAFFFQKKKYFQTYNSTKLSVLLIKTRHNNKEEILFSFHLTDKYCPYGKPWLLVCAPALAHCGNQLD
jgi:hypothetical protein